MIKTLYSSRKVYMLRQLTLVSLTLQDSFNLGHHWLDAFLNVRGMIAVAAIFVLRWPHFFGYRHTLFQQSVHVIVKLLLEEVTVTARAEGHR